MSPRSLLIFTALAVVTFCALADFKEPVKPGVMLDDFLCKLDPRINASTLTSFRNGTYLKQIKQYLWASACGRSRGVFTLTNEPEYAGNTYSCALWPTQWGIKQVDDWFKTPALYAQHLTYLDLYIQGNFNTTAVHAPGTCDFNTFSIGWCGDEEKRSSPYKVTPWAQRLGARPFRGVNIGGVFVLEPWITPTFTNWSESLPDQFSYATLHPEGSNGYAHLVQLWTKWYTPEDFSLMKEFGLNSVRLPVGWWYWADVAKVARDPYTVPKEDVMRDDTHPITAIIKMAMDAGLVVVLDLHGAPGSQNGLDNSGQRSTDPRPERWGAHWFYDKENQEATTTILVTMAQYIDALAQRGIDNVVALELLNEPWVFGDMSIVRDFYFRTIEAIRHVSSVPLIVHDAFRHQEWDWLLWDFPYENVFMDTHIYHAFNADDIASSSPNCDRNKMIVAENIACGYGSMLRYKTCLSLPTLVGEWSLAVDDCINVIRGAGGSVQFKDFGQCKNLKQRIGDPFWTEHYRKFAMKQMAMAERELGWFFWTWKTGPGSEKDPSTAYWSYSQAVKSQIIPSDLADPKVNQAITEACYTFEDTNPYFC